MAALPSSPDLLRGPESEIQTLTFSSKGQIAISAETRRKLGIEKGSRYLEVVVGKCIVLVPEQAAIEEIYAIFQRQLEAAGVTAESLSADIEQHRDEGFRQRYPALADQA